MMKMRKEMNAETLGNVTGGSIHGNIIFYKRVYEEAKKQREAEQSETDTSSGTSGQW